MAGERTLPGLGLKGFYDDGSDGWGTQLSTDLRTISVVARLSVKSRVTALPGSPADGDIYIVPSGGDANKVAVRDNGAWVYLVPTEGWSAWVQDEDITVVYSGSAWTREGLAGSATYNPPSLAVGAIGAETTVTVTGAALGDFVQGVSFSLDSQGVEFLARVSAADTVAVIPRNPTAGTIDLASGTLRVSVRKA